uniref:EF-hand domain-containing protein n=1 Tax=Alexandrium catenella TaxID=2925 RepID=A0A7S1WT07_ALECA|mmetsp:Transcript_88557/g.235224  ORF Transcript_88557/g.235224 Transcript_88557/m.235224 type:complete len:490 (+) Transcript_88557:1-1470(+)
MDIVLGTLQKLAKDGNRPHYAEDMKLLLDLLAIIGMNKEAFLGCINTSLPAREAGVLPSLVRRLFIHMAPELQEARVELEALVNKLFNLMIGICVEAPVDLINKMIADIIDQSKPYSLVGFAMRLIKGEERVEKAAGRLINSICWIAQQAAEGRSLAQMQLFARGPDGETPRIDVILEAVMDLLLPFLGPELRRPIYSVLEVLTDLYELSTDPAPNNFIKRAPFIAQGIATALCIPQHQVSGIFALAKGDWEKAVDLCKPFCDLDPQVLHEMMRFLPTIQKNCKSGVDLVKNIKEQVEEDYIKSRVKQISGNVVERKGTALDLFDLVDLDRNGTISLEEFRMCTLRLGFHLGEHRVLEVFSRCKKNVGSINRTDKGQELNAEEFQEALDYLQKKVAHITLSMIGNSLGYLMCKLVYLCFTLFLCCVFIFLAMNAFLSGGVFSAVVNSGLTISMGLSMAWKDAKDKSGGDDQRKMGALVEEIQDMVMNDQ